MTRRSRGLAPFGAGPNSALRAAIPLAFTGAVAIAGAVSGCSSAEPSETAEADAWMLLAPDAISEFALVASRITLNDRTQVTLGSIGASAGAGTAVSAGFDTRISVGKRVIAHRVSLAHRALAGAVFADELLAQFATVESSSPFLAPPAPPAIAAFTSGTCAISVGSGQTSTLSPGKYGLVTVNGTLRLSGGTYEITSLRLGNDAGLAADGPSLVRVSERFVGQDRIRVFPAAPLGAAGLKLLVAGAGGVSFGNDARVTALLIANAGVGAGDRLTWSGAVAATSITIGHDARVTFDDGFQCSTDAGCEDGNACTTNQCIDGQCTSAELPNDSACTTSEGGNGTCQSGTCVSVPSSARVQEIFAVCATCHSGAQPSAGLDLTDIRLVRDNELASRRCTDFSRLIFPGNPGGSYLFSKIADTPACATGRTNCSGDIEAPVCRLGLRMPRNLPPLPDNDIEEVREWIVAGAP